MHQLLPNTGRITHGWGPSLIFAVGLFVCGCFVGTPTNSVTNLGAEDLAVLVEIMAEEDRRPTFAEATALRNGLASDNALLRHFSARGLGRLEEPAALAVLGRTLTDPDPLVRLTAAGAIAQSVFNANTETAADLLRGRLDEEHDPAVRGELAQSLGRLRPASAATIEQTQTILLDVAQRDASLETLVPTLRGFESLVRTNADIELASGARDRLVGFIHYGRGSANSTEAEQLEPEAMFAAARVRRLALAVLNEAGRADAETVEIALYDPDVEVRRLAAAAASGVDDLYRQRLLLQIALADTEGQVRYEGLRGYGRLEHGPEGCATITTLVEDDDPNVSLQAIDLLTQVCHEVSLASPGISTPSVVNMLRMLVDPPINASRPITWHSAAHALTTLAHVHPDAAEQLISVPSVDPIWQVRMYAARAAATIGAIDVLEQLVQDPFPNVADAALRGLDTILGHAADGAAVAALNSEDYQRLITASDMLEATEHPDALAMLIEALERVTLEKRETSRDPRLAILRRIGELGDAENTDSILPYIEDFDPRIAAQAAQVLLSWTGSTVSPSPTPLPLAPFPTIEDLINLEQARVRMKMQGGDVIEVKLHPYEAPTNVARFARQARDGYFDGLTFHRVVANFVIQGGSPGANEYVGDGPYSRDEVGNRSHLRGTVGISTRGRDTGDSQIFINLVDNVRLDYNYTVIGTIVSGMEVVDRVLEGSIIERATIEPWNDPQ